MRHAPANLEGVTRDTPKAVLSVDVEDYYHVEAFSDIVDRAQWDTWPSRVENNTHRLLDIFDSIGVSTTCFILGWVAEKFPALIQEIARRGHEIACHSYWHRPIFQLSPEQFQEDTSRAKNVIEQAAGTQVFGYRAPSFSVTKRSLWALDILRDLGFRYDSSIFPVRHDFYGIPDAPRAPFRAGGLIEIPMTTFRMLGDSNLPVGGGGYLRLLPWSYTRFGVARAWADGLPLITYIHPWEIDPDQPRLNGRLVSRIRHYTNLSTMAARLRRLCALARFQSFRDSGILEQAAPIVDLAPTLNPKGAGIISHESSR